jgi:hypothetical protein
MTPRSFADDHSKFVRASRDVLVQRRVARTLKNSIQTKSKNGAWRMCHGANAFMQGVIGSIRGDGETTHALE